MEDTSYALEIKRLRKTAIHLELVENYRALRKFGHGSSDKIKISKKFLKIPAPPAYNAEHQALKDEYVRVLRVLLKKRVFRVFTDSKILKRLTRTQNLLTGLNSPADPSK